MTITKIILPADFGNDGLRDAEIVRQFLEYNDGKLFWKIRPAPPVKIGQEAGTISNGYRAVSLGSVRYKSHRLVWLIVNGYWPSDQIDHIDGFRSNNKIQNLRDVTRQKNMMNAAKSSLNTSGVTGVTWRSDTKKWRCRIKINKKYINLGDFAEFSEAVFTRINAEKKYGFSLSHGRDLIKFSSRDKF